MRPSLKNILPSVSADDAKDIALGAGMILGALPLGVVTAAVDQVFTGEKPDSFFPKSEHFKPDAKDQTGHGYADPGLLDRTMGGLSRSTVGNALGFTGLYVALGVVAISGGFAQPGSQSGWRRAS